MSACLNRIETLLYKIRHVIFAVLHIDDLRESIHVMTAGQLCFVALAVLMVIGGNAGQLLILNLWVNDMGSITPAFPVLTISAFTMAVGFVVSILIRKIIFRVYLGFLWNRKAMLLTVLIGMCNAFNGVLIVYATQPTPEFMQALLLCTQVFWTLVFSKIAFRDRRRMLTISVLASFLCVAGGIILGASPQFSSSSPTDSNTKYWTLIFAASMIPGALYNVFASMYMRSFTHPHPTLASVGVVHGVVEGHYDEDGNVVTKPLNLEYHYDLNLAGETSTAALTSDDTTVKLMMLATTGISQLTWMFILLPIDSAPWFGSSATIAQTRSNLEHGWACVFQRKYGCGHTYAYYIGFNASYFINYLGSAYLNHFSATLNSMVTQLSAPIAAIIMIVFPSINVFTQPVAVGPAVGAIVLLIVGCLLYTMWEQGTRRHL